MIGDWADIELRILAAEFSDRIWMGEAGLISKLYWAREPRSKPRLSKGYRKHIRRIKAEQRRGRQ